MQSRSVYSVYVHDTLLHVWSYYITQFALCMVITHALGAMCVVITHGLGAMCVIITHALGAMCMVITHALDAMCMVITHGLGAMCVVITHGLGAMCVVITHGLGATCMVITHALGAMCMVITHALGAMCVQFVNVTTSVLLHCTTFSQCGACKYNHYIVVKWLYSTAFDQPLLSASVELIVINYIEFTSQSQPYIMQTPSSMPAVVPKSTECYRDVNLILCYASWLNLKNDHVRVL